MSQEYSIRSQRTVGGAYLAVALDMHRERHDANVDAQAATRHAARAAVKRDMAARGYTLVPFRAL